ncbi:LysR family transcriptional regulator [Cupriavidus necator]|uniref:LysR family transcriptional regulator n=1 Tax=Cupriavidus necator TaxID=106590 RepID=UPI001F15A3FE|nr:LysR family transcriptional regulator [Cupriavidus necator]
MTDVDLRLLRIFKTVTDCRGLSAAESALNMNLSTISSHMTDLERRLGLRLCERGRRGFHLTDEGHSVYQAADSLLNTVEQFRADIGAIRHELSGELAIGVVDNTITDVHAHIAEAIVAVKQKGGDLHLKMEIKSPNEIEAAVLERKIHVGIGPFRAMHPGLSYLPLHTESLCLYCGHSHELFKLASNDISTADLKKMDYVSRGYMRESREMGDAISFKVAATVYHMEAVATLILSGKFIGYLPEHYASQWVKQGLMRAINPAVLSHRAEFSLAVLKGREHTMAVRVFVGALQSALPPDRRTSI